MKTLHLSIVFVLLLFITIINTSLMPVQGTSGSAFFMKSNSTAKIYADFAINVLNNQSWGVEPQIATSLDDFSTKPASMSIYANPNSFTGNQHHVHVTYTITAKDNAKGVYPLFLFFCGTSPLVVGLNESEVSPAIFNKYFTAVYTCPAILGGTPDMNILGYSGMLSKTLTVNPNNTITVNSVSKLEEMSSPLQQFKSGIALKDITCAPDLKLVIKAKSRSPACIKPDDISKLVERGWADKPNSLQEQLDMITSCIGMTDACRHRYDVITGLDNDTGMMTLENQTYYFDTPNYTATTYVHPVQITFHDVNFTLFPPGFRGGLPLGGCPGQYYWVDAKFADGTAELLHIYAGSQSCADSVPIMLSNHIIPQAGLTVYDGKMRLLVRDENQSGKDIVLQKPSSMVKPFPICNPNPAKEKLIREKQQVLTDALLNEEKKYGGFENRTQNLPWSSISYDCVDNALEIGILPQYFNSDFLPKYFEKIRSIVGNNIDVVLSPEEYASPV